MKRFLFILTALLLLAGIPGMLYPTVAHAAAKANTADNRIQTSGGLLGRDVADITAVFGKQSRSDVSEYGFRWYVYNRDYNRFMMIGVAGGKTVAAYSNSRYITVQNGINIGTKRDTVRKKLGKPVQYLQCGNSLYILAKTDQKDQFLRDGYYITVYYDKYDSYKVTGVLKVLKAYEDRLVARPAKLTAKMAQVYARESFDLVNSIRARRNLSILKYDKKAEKLAKFRSSDMKKRDYFDHYSPEGMSPADYARKMGMQFNALCENIASGHRSAISAFEALMNSSGHRKNILNSSVKQMGAGAAYGGDRAVIVTYILYTRK